MSRAPLTDLQLAVMNALWTLGQGPVAEVQAALGEQGKSLAATTVATLLQRMSKQGWVSAEKVGRQLVYRPQVARQEAAQGALRRVVRAFFGGSPAALTAQLLETEALSREELDALRRLIAEKEP